MEKERNNRIARNSLFLYLRMLFTLVVSLYVSRVVLQELGVEDFGIYNVVGGIVIILTFLNSSLAVVTQRFLTYEIGARDFNKLRQTFNVSLSIHLLIAVVILLLSETLGLWFICCKLVIPAERIATVLWVYHLSVLSSLFGIIGVPYGALIIARERMGVLASISMAEVLLRLVVVYLLRLFAGDKLLMYGVFSCAASLVVFCLYAYVSYVNFYEARVKRLIWDARLFRDMFVFAGWTTSGNLAFLGITQGLNILLNLYFGPSANAARAISLQVQNAINGFAVNLQTSLNPQITKSYATDDLTYMHKLICSSSKICFLLMLSISIPLFLEASFVLDLWLAKVPAHTVSFIQLTLLTGILPTLGNPLVVAIHATGRIKKFQVWESSILLMIVPVSYLFLKWGYPAEIVFIVHLIIALIAQCMGIWIVIPAIHMSYHMYLKKVVLCIVTVAPLCLLCTICVFFLMSEGYLRLFTITIVSLFSMSLFLYVVGFDRLEKEVFNGIIKKSFFYAARFKFR